MQQRLFHPDELYSDEIVVQQLPGEYKRKLYVILKL